MTAASLLLAVVLFLHWFDPVRWPPLALEFLTSLHGPGFALVALAAYLFLGDRLPGLSRYAVAAAIAMGIGLLSEASQIPGGRAAQLSDLGINALGIAGALGTLALLDEQFRRHIFGLRRMLLGGGCALLLVYAILPSLMLAYAFVAQYRAMPQLVTFEHGWESATYLQAGSRMPARYAAPRQWPADGTTVAHAVEDGRWGILLALRPWPNWSGYSAVRFVAASATDRSYRVGVAIRETTDAADDPANRYYTTIDVGPVPQDYSIDFAAVSGAAESRSFDFSHVAAFVISAASPGDGVSLLIDDIRLE
ncbi:MAG: hypothetical protein KJO31_17735 [Gammaproteobacteria bacterium]|nr:hypothetical protein [Gammaproteobacteria bacterium]